MMGRSRRTLPTASAAKAAAMTRGKRSGAVIDTRRAGGAKSGGFEDMDAMFEDTTSPDRGGESDSESELKKPSRDDLARTSSARKKNHSRNPNKPIRMSLPGGREDTDDSKRKPTRSQYQAKVKKNNKKRISWSPSELSAVSTAPPTPRDPDEEEVEEEEDDLYFESQGDGEEEEEDVPRTLEEREPFPSPREPEEEQLSAEEDGKSPVRDEEKSIVVGSAKAAKGKRGQTVGSPTGGDSEGGDSSPQSRGSTRRRIVEDESDDDDEDLIPPNPPEEGSSDAEGQEDLEDTSDKSMDPKTPSGDIQQDDINFDEDDNGGPGFAMMDDEDEQDMDGSNMVHDPETPVSVRADRARREQKNIEKVRVRSRKKNKDKKLRKRGSLKRRKPELDGDSSSEDETPEKSRKPKKRAAFATSPKGTQAGDREFENVSLSNFVEPSPDNPSLRRSRRARCKPLAFWKNEKLVYGAHKETGELGEAMGKMPVVTAIQKALPTPYKKRAVTSKPSSEGYNNAHRKKATTSISQKHVEQQLFDYHKLRKQGKLMEGENARVWDDGADDALDLKVVSYAKNMEGSELPVSNNRTREEGRVAGKAAQGFNIPNNDNENYVGYIMGNLVLPPKGIKDAESVGPCSQTFTVCQCQPGALEVAYGDPDQPEGHLNPDSAQRFYLGPGDLFRVPPGNCYRLENNSKTTECLLTWTIIRPTHNPART